MFSVPPSSRRVLIVDDDPIVSEVIASYLRNEGHSVSAVSDGFAALEDLATVRADAVVLDRMLPGIEGLEVCRRMRSFSDAPILLVTARSSEADRIAGFEVGADDYLAKPFSPRELTLRVNALLRRTVSAETPESDARIGCLRLDGAAHRIFKHESPLPLTGREFSLLAFLLRHPGQVFDRHQLLRAVWGWDVGDVSTVTVHVRRLREKCEQNPSEPTILQTIWGVGYALNDSACPHAEARLPTGGERRVGR